MLQLATRLRILRISILLHVRWSVGYTVTYVDLFPVREETKGRCDGKGSLVQHHYK